MIRSTRRLAILACALAGAAALMAGCGGGGDEGGGTAGDDAAAQQQAANYTQGTAAAGGTGAASPADLSSAMAALGQPSEVSARSESASLSGLDRFGTPKNVFKQQVRESASGGSSPGTEGSTGGGSSSSGGGTTTTPAPSARPIDSSPVVAVPGTPSAASPTTPAATAPTGSDPTTLPGTPTTTTTTPGGTTTTPGTADPTVPVSSPNALEADFDVSGEPVVAREGDAIPPDTQQFTVKTIGVGSVALQLTAGLLPDGSDTVTLEEGQSITLYNQTAHQSYKIKLVDIRSVG